MNRSNVTLRSIFAILIALNLSLASGCRGYDRSLKNDTVTAGGLGSDAAFFGDLSDRIDKLDRFFADLPEDISVETLSAALSERDLLERERSVLEEPFNLSETMSLEVEARRAVFDQQMARFERVAASDRIVKTVKRKMWQQLCQRWQLDPGEGPTRLVWDASLSMPTVVFPPALQIHASEDTMISVQPEDQVIPSFEGYLFLEDEEDYYIEAVREGYVTEVREFRVDWQGLHEMSFDLKPLKLVALDSKVEMGMVPINPGRFKMGFVGKFENERPVHEVSISREFWLGRTEVTQGQFAAILELPEQRFVGEELPVHNISWTDAREFCARLTEQERSAGRLPEGYVYRLPTEAEWEYACRAGTSRAFSADPQAMTWHMGSSGGQAKPVASRLPNPWGLYDMHGNVLEWCLDGFSEYPEERQVDPLRGKYEKIKVTRGGAWTKPLKFCRSSHRDSWLFGLNMPDIGFRVALAPDLEDQD